MSVSRSLLLGQAKPRTLQSGQECGMLFCRVWDHGTYEFNFCYYFDIAYVQAGSIFKQLTLVKESTIIYSLLFRDLFFYYKKMFNYNNFTTFHTISITKIVITEEWSEVWFCILINIVEFT